MNKTLKPAMPRETKAQAVLMGCFLVGGVSGGALGALKGMGVSPPMPVLAGLALLLLVGLVWAMFYYWRLIDEAAKEAHKFAWFWGGSSALALVLPALLLFDTARLEALLGPHEARYWFLAGVQVLIWTQLIGYALAWSGWWLFRRR